MKLRRGSDAILVGINTILADDPSLTVRGNIQHPKLRRIVLDSMARTPLSAKVASDTNAAWTTVVIGKRAPKNRVAALAKQVNVLVAPAAKSLSLATRHRSLDLRWLMNKLGRENVTSLLVEGGGEVNASFLLGGFAQRVAFFYAPKILGGRDSHKAVAGKGVRRLSEVIRLDDVQWRRLGEDLLLTARVESVAG
jgi:diaminohydroxyphosphoribosylaminopyrimidine deaminase/5-amino-6-(5-phosphoribosylamino)uracil reductase